MKEKILMSLMHHLTRLLSKVARKTSHTLNDLNWKFRKLADKFEGLSISKEDKRLFEEWQDEEDRIRAEEEQWEDESHEKYAQWKKEQETSAMNYAIAELFEEMSDYEVEFFKTYVIDDLIEDLSFMDRVISLVCQDALVLSKWDIENDITIHSELSKTFAFMYNVMMGYIRKHNSDSRREALFYAYKKSLNNRSYLDAIDFETKRRFSEILENDLPRHEKPKPKRTKI